MNATSAALTTGEPGASSASPTRNSAIADPLPIATALLGLQLVVYVARWITVTPQTLAESALTAANNDSLLIAAVAQVGAGVLCLIRGNAYVGYVATTFGLWLVGFHMLATAHNVDPDSFAWFIGGLLVPLILLMIPAALHRHWAFIVGFGAILVMIIVDAVGFHILHVKLADAAATKTVPNLGVVINLLRTSAYAAGVAAIALFWLTARSIFEATGFARPTEHIG